MEGKGFLAYLESHPALSGGLLVVIITLVVVSIQRSKSTSLATQTQSATLPTNADTGVQPYLVGSNTFETMYTNSGNNSGNSTTTTPPPVVVGPIRFPSSPVRANPVPQQSFTHHGARIWDQSRKIGPGETATSIASGTADYMHRYQGMPSSVTVTAADLHAHNLASTFKAGTTIITPRWDQNVNW